MGNKVVILDSSEDVLYHDNCSYEENTLVSLLQEAHPKNLSPNTKIRITRERLRKNYDENNPTVEDLIRYKSSVTLKELKDTYQKLTNRQFTPENEERRSDFRFTLLEKERERIDGAVPYLVFGVIQNQMNKEMYANK